MRLADTSVEREKDFRESDSGASHETLEISLRRLADVLRHLSSIDSRTEGRCRH